MAVLSVTQDQSHCMKRKFRNRLNRLKRLEGTKVVGNDKDIKSTGSDLTLMTIKIIRVGSNQEYQRLCSSMKTLDQVFISIERDNASVDTSSNQKRPRKYQRAMRGNQNRARRLQQQPQFI